MTALTFERRGMRKLLGIVVPSFLIALTLAVVGAGLVPVQQHGRNSYSRSAVGHDALVAMLERLGIPVVRSQARSGLHASRGGVLLILDAQRDQDDVMIDLDRLRKMVDNAPVTLLALPKWDVRPMRGRPDWARSIDRVQWMATRLLADLELRDTELVPDVQTMSIPWTTQNFGPPPVLADAQLVRSGDLDPLIQHGPNILVGETRFRGRRIVLLTDPDLLTTRGLADESNAILAVRLIEHLRRGGPVVVDEVLHGYASNPTVWRSAFQPPVVYLVAHGLLCLLLLLWAGWRRFGPPPAPRRVHPEGLRERVDQAAKLLGAGPTAGVALTGYLAETRRAVQRHYAAPGTGYRAPPETLDRLARARGAEETWSTLSRAVKQAVSGRTPSIPEAVQLGRRVHQWRQEMTHDAR